jgi:protein-export membrane protein SecD
MTKQKTKAQLRSKIRWGIFGIFALLIIASAYDAPKITNRVINKVNSVTHIGLPNMPEKDFSLGLDLQGGAHLVYNADVTHLAEDEKGAAVEGGRDVIERRVNGLGIGEPSVQTTKVNDDYRIVVDLPGVDDVKEAISMIGETPILEFKEVNNEPARDLNAEEKKELADYNVDAKARANAALRRILAGETYDDLASVSELEISKNNGGYIGYVRESRDPDLHGWAKTVGPNAQRRAVLENSFGYHVVKRGEEKLSEDQAQASHILICYLGSSGCNNAKYTKEEAKAKANELFQQVNATNFGKLASEHSSDTTANLKGGDLGIFGKGQMVKSFEDAVFAANVGEIVGPVETQFGYHIIYKTNQPKEFELWDIFVKKRLASEILPPHDEWKSTDLSGKQLERAEVVTDHQTGAIQVSLQFDDEGTELFKNLTEKYVGQPIAIFLDGEAISVPTVQVPIRDGRAVITGRFDLQEARLLSQRLNAGALPVPIDLISQQAIGASLGQESLAKSLKAGVAGVILVMIFMLFYYRLPGILSVISLSVYIALTLAIFKLIGVTLTLAGIAGFILSIGMAVDANVLIFERLKEELQDGKSLKAAVEEGFLRAWTSIRDGNLSTLITCLILIGFGSSFVKGFAITLLIGILLSMFSAITITRMMLRFVVPWFGESANWMFVGAKKKHNS